MYPNKDALLFPEPVLAPDGRLAYAMLHRPMWDLSFILPGEGEPLPAGLADPRPGIWVSFAPADAVAADLAELTRLEQHRLVALPEQPWEALKIGGGTPPIWIEEGWLVLHHGVTGAAARGFDVQPKVHYSAGALVLDAGDVTRVIARSTTPLLEPELPEEVTGTVGNVVFPTAIEPAQNGDASAFDVYYGMADRVDRGRPPVEDRHGGRSAMTRSELLGLGVVGCGGFGRFALASVVDLPGVEVRAVTDVDPDRAASVAAAFGASVVPGVQSLLAEPAVDVVMIATPPVTHGSMTRAAAEAGKHVFCEKPLATSLPDASAAIDAATGRDDQAHGRLRHALEPVVLADPATAGGCGGPTVSRCSAGCGGSPWRTSPVTSGCRRTIGSGTVRRAAASSSSTASISLMPRPGCFGDPPITVAAVQAARTSGEIDTVVANTVHAGGATATYAHSFAHPDAAEYQSVLLDWGFAHGTLRGWIPVDLELDIWTDEAGASAIAAAVDDPERALAVPGVRASGMERIELAITPVVGVAPDLVQPRRGPPGHVPCPARRDTRRRGGKRPRLRRIRARRLCRSRRRDPDRAATDGFQPSRPVTAWRPRSRPRRRPTRVACKKSTSCTQQESCDVPIDQIPPTSRPIGCSRCS